MVLTAASGSSAAIGSKISGPSCSRMPKAIVKVRKTDNVTAYRCGIPAVTAGLDCRNTTWHNHQEQLKP